MDSLPTVLLKPGEADRIVPAIRGSNHTEILRLNRAGCRRRTRSGQKDHRQRFLGVGFLIQNQKSMSACCRGARGGE